MFGEKCQESSSTTGTGAYALGTAVGEFNAWRDQFADGSAVFYCAENGDGTIWEIGYGTLAYGAPDTISRTLIASSTGALISWVSADAPIYVFSATIATPVKHMLSPLVNGVAGVPAWLPAAAAWIDYALGIATAWVKNRYVSGTRTAAASHAEEGRHYLGLAGGTANIFSASQRLKTVDVGATDHILVAADIGKQFDFDCTAAGRTMNGVANGTAGIGEGFYFFVRSYGSATNGVTFAPAGVEATTLAAIPIGRVTKVWWDNVKATWVADYVAPATQVVRSYLAGLTLSAAGGTGTFGIAAGQAADSTNADMMSLGSAYTKTTSAWAVGSGNGGLDTGAVATGTWYHAWLIKRPDTGVVDVLFSLSASSPTMPSGYTLKRRIGSMKTDGSSQWVKFIQDGDLYQWDVPVLDVADTNPGTSLQTKTLPSVPPGIIVLALLNIQPTFATSAAQLYTHDLAVSDMAASQTVAPLGVGNSSNGASGLTGGAWQQIRTDTSARIGYRIDASGGSDVIRMATLGWIDRRGRDT